VQKWFLWGKRKQNIPHNQKVMFDLLAKSPSRKPHLLAYVKKKFIHKYGIFLGKILSSMKTKFNIDFLLNFLSLKSSSESFRIVTARITPQYFQYHRIFMVGAEMITGHERTSTSQIFQLVCSIPIDDMCQTPIDSH
jgi:hypothetical protein